MIQDLERAFLMMAWRGPLEYSGACVDVRMSAALSAFNARSRSVVPVRKASDSRNVRGRARAASDYLPRATDGGRMEGLDRSEAVVSGFLGGVSGLIISVAHTSAHPAGITRVTGTLS